LSGTIGQIPRRRPRHRIDIRTIDERHPADFRDIAGSSARAIASFRTISRPRWLNFRVRRDRRPANSHHSGWNSDAREARLDNAQ
jgi:hypothetical protein